MKKTGFGSGSAALSLVVATMSMACASHEGSNEDFLSTASGTDGIPWETFRASAEIAPNGALVVEGDMAFSTEAKLRRYWEEHRAPGRGQELSVNTVVVNGIVVDDVWAFPQNMNLTYCIGPGFTSEQLDDLLPAFESATAAWGRVAAIRFVLQSVGSSTCNADDDSLAFDVQFRTGSSNSFFPLEPRSMRTLFIGSAAWENTENGRTLGGIVLHELGHGLGYRHEHVWIDCTGEGPTLPAGTARLVTEYDEMSVMHDPDCRDPPGGGFSLTNLDHYGSARLYGLHPALISVL